MVLSLPLVLAVAAAVAFASRSGIAAALGLGSWRWTDVVVGVSIGLVVRAAVELITPSTGSGLGGTGFGPVESPALRMVATVVLALGVIVVSPVVEEVFFRGLVARAMVDALQPLGSTVAGVVAVLVSTGAFVALHLIPSGAAVPVALIVGTAGVGLGAGILTILTGRLAGAITVHVVFNALGVVILLV